jgi:hypothetical protein
MTSIFEGIFCKIFFKKTWVERLGGAAKLQRRAIFFWKVYAASRAASYMK